MHRTCAFILWSVCALLAAHTARAVPATNAPRAFQLKAGFSLELVASEPLLFDPVAMAFDAKGRLFVAEHRDYPGPDPGPLHLGRVRMLEDTDGDGRFDLSQDFADDLPSPSAVICWDNGVIVAAGLQILHCKDTDGDGRADQRRVLFSGPTNATDRADVPLAIRSFVWGLDNRIHAAAGGKNFGLPRPGFDSAGALERGGPDFAFDPRTGTVEAGVGYGSMGVAFDVGGRKFVCANAQPLRQVMWEARDLLPQSSYVLPPPLAGLTGPAAVTPLFALREAFVPTTSAARRGRAHRAVEYFSAATSLLVYRGNAFPPAYRGNVFVADAQANLIHRVILRGNGPEFIAERPADESGTEFLATTNAWVRPLQLADGPDGALYILDLHREFLDPPAALPDSARTAAAQRQGNDRGRIYRVVPASFKPPPAPRLAEATIHELVTNLAHLNGWHRDTAARLLYERNDPSAIPLLTNMLNRAQSPLARLHALGALDGLGALRDDHVARGLRDPDVNVRLHAVRLARKRAPAADALVGVLGNAAHLLAVDVSPSVRYELALALAGSSQPRSVGHLLEILRRNPDNAWTRAAVLHALAPDPGNAFELAVDDNRLQPGPAREAFLCELALLIGTRNDQTEIAAVWAGVDRVRDGRLGFAVLHHLDEGLRRTGRALGSVVSVDRLRPVLQHAAIVAATGDAEVAWRVEAIRLLAAAPFVEIGDFLLALVSPPEPVDVQVAALRTLARFRDDRVGTGLTQRWPGMSDRGRAVALDVLLSRTENCGPLLAALQTGRIRGDDLSSVQQLFLRSHADGAISRRANALLGTPVRGDRSAALKRLLPAVDSPGRAARGRQVYLARCQQCHRFRGEGFAFGPDLESAAVRGKEWLLTHLADPNRVVPAARQAVVIETAHVGSVLGSVEHETPAGLHLERPSDGRMRLPRRAIGSGMRLEVSAMPENLEAGLSPEAVADLLEWLAPAPR